MRIAPPQQPSINTHSPIACNHLDADHLLLAGFALAGGAAWAACAFCLALLLYNLHHIPLEEALLAEAFGARWEGGYGMAAVQGVCWCIYVRAGKGMSSNHA
jgi:hypothetical protein